MVLSFPYNMNIGTAETIKSSIYYHLKDSEYQSLLKAYVSNAFPLFLDECSELEVLERDIRKSIYDENAAIYLANKDLINKIIEDKDLGLTKVDHDQIVASYNEIFNCDILFPKEVAEIFDVLERRG